MVEPEVAATGVAAVTIRTAQAPGRTRQALLPLVVKVSADTTVNLVVNSSQVGQALFTVLSVPVFALALA